MKPILMNTENVRAILDGRKTVTRRVIKGVPNRADLQPYDVMGAKGLIASNSRVYNFKPPYQVGDVLYVRETWERFECCCCDGDLNGMCFNTPDDREGCYVYKASHVITGDARWRPSIHMPKEAARIFLRVTGIRAERLRDITAGGVLNEGIPNIEPPPICQKEITYPESFPRGFDEWDELRKEDWIQGTARARYIGWYFYADKLLREFRNLWNSTIKKSDLDKYGWDASPWVWVIEFERISEGEAQ